MSENSPGLPPSPEGHIAAGSLFLSSTLRVGGKLPCSTNERGKKVERGLKNSLQISFRFPFNMLIG